MTLTSAQLLTLHTDLTTNTNTVTCSDGVVRAIDIITGTLQTPDNAYAIAQWYNQNSTFWVWYPTSSVDITGGALKLSDISGLTTANSTRVQVTFQVRQNKGFDPSNADDRSLFGNVFSVASASGTLTNLLSVWQRLATHIEQLFATGTGTQATGTINTDGSLGAGSPGTLVFDGSINYIDIQEAWSA